MIMTCSATFLSYLKIFSAIFTTSSTLSYTNSSANMQKLCEVQNYSMCAQNICKCLLQQVLYRKREQ